MYSNLWQMLMFSIAGWFNEHQQVKLEFALEQLRVYKELAGGKRLRLNDDQRRRLAAKGKKLGLSGSRELVTIRTSSGFPPPFLSVPAFAGMTIVSC